MSYYVYNIEHPKILKLILRSHLLILRSHLLNLRSQLLIIQDPSGEHWILRGEPYFRCRWYCFVNESKKFALYKVRGCVSKIGKMSILSDINNIVSRGES